MRMFKYYDHYDFYYATKKSNSQIWQNISPKSIDSWDTFFNTGPRNYDIKNCKDAKSDRVAHMEKTSRSNNILDEYYTSNYDGGNAFFVKIKGKKIYIYKPFCYDEKTESFGYKLCKTINKFIKVFICRYINPYDDYAGNLLIKLSKHKYLYIGESIQEYTFTDEIKHYFSGSDGSRTGSGADCIAFGTENAYLLMENVYVSNKNLPDYLYNANKTDKIMNHEHVESIFKIFGLKPKCKWCGCSDNI